MEKSTKGTGGGGASGVGAPPAPVQQQPSPSPSRTSTAATAIATANDTGPYPRVVAPTRCLLDDEPSSDEEGDADSGGEEGGGGRSGGGGSSEFVSPRNAPANDLLVHAMARRGMPREIRAVGGARGLEDGGRDAYVRRAARVRSLIGGALKKVAGGLLAPSPKMVGGGAAGDKRSHEEMEAEQGALSGPPNKLQPSPRRRLRRQQQQQHEHAAEMAREKAAEVLVLQRELKEAKDRNVALRASTSALREAAASESKRMERLSEALRIAGSNAAAARADSDAAEARAAALASQVQDLRSVAEGARTATAEARVEHHEIAEATRRVEARLVGAEAALAQSRRDLERADREGAELLEGRQEMEGNVRNLRDELDRAREGLSRAQREAAERDAVACAREERVGRVEAELREARSMLVEVTSVAAETEATTTVLNDTIAALQKENRTIHDKMRDAMADFSKEQEKLNTSLSTSEGEAQRLRLNIAADEEEIQRLRMQKADAEKQASLLKQKVADLERRAIESSSSVSLAGLSSSKSLGSSVGSGAPTLPSSKLFAAEHEIDAPNSGNPGGFVIPPLRSSSNAFTPKASDRTKSTDPASAILVSATKSNSITPGAVVSIRRGKENGAGRSSTSSYIGSTKSSACCICFKDAFGVMKSCACGNATCRKRAHASCLAKNVSLSLSHPGTPGVNLPPVLCREAA